MVRSEAFLLKNLQSAGFLEGQGKSAKRRIVKKNENCKKQNKINWFMEKTKA